MKTPGRHPESPHGSTVLPCKSTQVPWASPWKRCTSMKVRTEALRLLRGSLMEAPRKHQIYFLMEALFIRPSHGSPMYGSPHRRPVDPSAPMKVLRKSHGSHGRKRPIEAQYFHGNFHGASMGISVVLHGASMGISVVLLWYLHWEYVGLP